MTLRQAQSYTKPYRNLALFPASLLPFKAQWEEIALNHSVQGKPTVLIILPSSNHYLRRTLETVATLLEADGHQVTTLTARQFARI